MKIEKDDKVRLWMVTPEGQTSSITFGSWKHKKPGFWFKKAMLRFQRYQGSNSLAITCLNIKEFPDGELLIFTENTLMQAARANRVIK